MCSKSNQRYWRKKIEKLFIFPSQPHSLGKPKFSLKIEVKIAKAQAKQNP